MNSNTNTIYALFMVSLIVSASARPLSDQDGCDGETFVKCCSTTGVCPNSACPGNDLGSNLVNCNDNTCPTWTCDSSSFNPQCDAPHCLGRVQCDGCEHLGALCFYDGVSSNFKVCGEPIVNPPVDCVVSAWSNWFTCVDGKQSRMRSVLTQPSNGGSACPDLVEYQACEALTSGCGKQVQIVQCKLDTTQPTTTC